MLLNRRALCLALLLGPIAGCNKQSGPRMPTAAPAEDTTLGNGDILDVRVLGEKELSGSYQVSPDGSTHFPFLGVLQVGGKDTTEVARIITDGLRNGGYLREPHVSVFLQSSTSKRISVIGAVAKPGTLPIVPGMTLVYAVSQAGGFTPLASKDDTVITRRIGSKLERYRVEVSQITRGDRDDVALRAGDIVYVPERVF